MPALDLMDAGREARPRLASVLAKATWNQHYVQIPTFDRLSLNDISSSFDAENTLKPSQLEDVDFNHIPGLRDPIQLAAD